MDSQQAQQTSPCEAFEPMLTGGHPNSLGRTVEVVEAVLSDQARLPELYNCYFSTDETVRLRTSSAFKRISKEHPDWLVPYIDRLMTEISAINQASTQWTLAELFNILRPAMTTEQRVEAEAILKKNLEHHTDWIVLINTMQTLAEWAEDDEALASWLSPQLERLCEDSRKSVARRAGKLAVQLSESCADS